LLPEPEVEHHFPPGHSVGWMGYLEIDDGGHFFLNPVDFAKRVIKTVNDDFSVYQGIEGGLSPRLPGVYTRPQAAGASLAVSGVTYADIGYTSVGEASSLRRPTTAAKWRPLPEKD
jgi:hypothetical protein